MATQPGGEILLYEAKDGAVRVCSVMTRDCWSSLRVRAGGVLPTVAEATAAIERLKQDLLARGEAAELFGRVREAGLAGLLGNLDQSVFGEPAYPTIESKAAHLLYFVIKNHPVAVVCSLLHLCLLKIFLHT
jgi:hypothetical protein